MTKISSEVDALLAAGKHPRRKASSRLAQVRAETPAGYRRLLANVRGATATPEGFAVTDEERWAQSLAAADAVELKAAGTPIGEASPYRLVYLAAGKRSISPEEFSSVEDVARGMRFLKARGFTAWVEDATGKFVPVEGARRKPRSA